MLGEEYTENVEWQCVDKSSVLAVASLLRSNYAFIAGGKAKSGAPIMTFSKIRKHTDITEDNHKRIISYLCNVPALHETEMGFVIVIDRREDDWTAVKTVLLRISCFFPKPIQMVLLLDPRRIFQKTFSDFKSKFIKDLEFKVVLCKRTEDLFDQIDPDQLTIEVGGVIEYNASEWIKHRANVENFVIHTEQISTKVQTKVRKLQEIEKGFPHDVIAMKTVIKEHYKVLQDILNNLSSADVVGHNLMNSIKGDYPQTPVLHQSHVEILQRLLVQLDETQDNVQEFWKEHESRLNQYLQLRQFEEDAKLFQDVAERRIAWLNGKMLEIGENVNQVDSLMNEFEEFSLDSKEIIEQGDKAKIIGEKLSGHEHFAVDMIRQKCIQLQSMRDQYWHLLGRRRELLEKSRDLHQRIDNAKTWCEKGEYMLAKQQLDNCKFEKGANEAICDIGDFLKTSCKLQLNNLEEFHRLFEGEIILKNAGEILKRTEEVCDMCEKRKQQIRKLVNVRKAPAPADQPETLFAGHINRDENKSGSAENSGKFNKLQSDADKKISKMRCVIKELIETEKIYVGDLEDILQGYYHKIDDSDMQHIMPEELVGKKEILFSNLEEILNFHKNTLLPELKNCYDMPAEVGKCFVHRTEEFHLYGIYCQNKFKSEALYKQIGAQHPFFLECKRQLDQRLGQKLKSSESLQSITLPLDSYLLKPIQRITKYHLFLTDMLRFTDNDRETETRLREALNSILEVNKCLNDSMHQMNIVGFPDSLSDQGKLLLQNGFVISVQHKKQTITDLRAKTKQRHIFLYEKSILFCKKKTYQQQTSYNFKNALKIAQIGLTEFIKGDEKKFELWLGGREEVYIMQASSLQVKEKWVKEIKKVFTSRSDQFKVTK